MVVLPGQEYAQQQVPSRGEGQAQNRQQIKRAWWQAGERQRSCLAVCLASIRASSRGNNGGE